MACGRSLLYFDPLHVAQLIAYDRIEGARVGDRKEDQVDIGAFEIERRQVSVLWEPNGVGQADENGIMAAGKRLGAEDCIAQSARLPLHGEKAFCRVIVLGEVADDIGLFGGNDQANLLGAGGDHALHQVFGHRLGAVGAIETPRADRQQLLGAAQRLHASRSSCCRDNADQAASSWARGTMTSRERAASKCFSSSMARASPVCSEKVRSAARAAMRVSSP